MAQAEFGSTSLASDANVVSYYKLENVNDEKAGARTLTNNGSISFAAAKFNNGGDLGSSNSTKYFSRTSDNYGIAGTASMSISFWVKITGTIGSGVSYPLILHRSQTTAQRFFFLEYFNNSGTKQLVLNNAGNSASYNVDLGTSAFHHIVMVRNGTTSTKLYLDNTDCSITSAQGTSGSAADFLYIGRNDSTGYCSGIFDDVVVFNRVLTASDVNIIYTNPQTTSGGAFLLNFV